MGIAVGRWEAEPWKECLRKHGRASQVVAEYMTYHFDDSTFPYDGNPFSVFEQNFVMAGFCMRRLAEKRLLTDRLNEKLFTFRCFPAITENFRSPLPASTSNMFFQNYCFNNPDTVSLNLRDFGNEIVHSSHVGIVTETDDDLLPIGIVVASDWRLSKRLLHITFNEWADLCGTVLGDRIVVTSDEWDPDTGQTKALRLSRLDL
jgi:hypothetical protein